MDRKKIKIVGGPTGQHTEVFIDGERQDNLIGVTIELEVEEVNKVTLVYYGMDVDIDIEAEVDNDDEQEDTTD